MICAARILGSLAICLLIAGAAFGQGSMTRYRFRLTISLETDGQLRTGSSVIEVAWMRQPDFGNGVTYLLSIRGQAVFVDLGNRGAVVASLQPGRGDRDTKTGPWGIEWIAPRAFHMGFTPEIPDLRMEGRREVTPDNLPRLIWFSDPTNPATAHVVTPAEIATELGPAARLASAEVEITNDPIVIDIDKKLPWYPELESRQKGRAVLGIPGQPKLVYTMFVGAGT